MWGSAGLTLEVPEAFLWVTCEGDYGEGGLGRRLSSPEARRALDQCKWAALWGSSRAVKAVGKLMELAQPSRLTMKPLMLAERHDMSVEFERLRDAPEVLPEDLVDLTDHLVETGAVVQRRGGGVKPSDDWSLGESRWEKQRTTAMKHGRRVLAWAMGAVDVQRDIPGGSLVGGLSGGSGRGSHGDGGITAVQIERIVAKAVEAALRDRGGAGGADPPAGRGPPAASLREVARGSVGKQENCSWSECEKVIAEIRVAAARQAADLARVKHQFGRHPAMQVEAYSFAEVVDRFPECERRACGLEELPEAEGVRVRHLWGYIELAVRRLAVMQKALEGRPGVESVEFGETWLREAVQAGKRRKSKKKAKAAKTEDSKDEEEGRKAAKERFAHLRTATEEELQRALDGSLSVKDIIRPPGERELSSSAPACPAGGPVKGLDMRVRRLKEKFDKGIAGWDPKKGLVADEKAQHCRTWEEWDESFTRLMCAAPEGALDLLAGNRRWMRVMAADFPWDPLRKFHDHLLARMVKDPTVTFELGSFSALWELYRREKGLKEKGSGAGGGSGGAGGSYSAGRRTRTVQAEAAKQDAGAQQEQGAKAARMAGAGKGEQVRHACFEHNSAEGCKKARCRFHHKCKMCGKEGHMHYEGNECTAQRKRLEGELSPGDATTLGELHDGEGAQEAPGQARCGDAEMWSGGSRFPVEEAEESACWWEQLRRLGVVSVWDAAGLPLAREAAGEAVGLAGTGTTELERAHFQQEVREVGAQVPLMSERAHLLAAALRDWPDVAFLVRGAACRVSFPFASEDPGDPYVVPNYVGEEHEEAMTSEFAKELAAGWIFDARRFRPRGVSALGMVERVRKGKLKYRPVWDYSRPARVGVNDWIDIQKDEFSSVRDAYGLLRPGMCMLKVGLEEAYRSLPVASQYWEAQCFEWGGVRYMDTRSPFGNRALPGIFMRYTRAILGWMQAQGVPCVGYLDGFFMVARTEAEAQEVMDLLIEFVTMLGFKVNRAKCEGPARRMELLGVLLSTEGERCTASIDDERVQHVTEKLREVRAEAAVGPVRRRKLEPLLGLLAFCSQVVWGMSLYMRHGFAMVAATTSRARMTVGTGVQQDLKAVERVIRLYNGRKVVLHKEDVYEDAFATDASKTKGMGGHCHRDYFLAWEDLLRMP
eukprot:gene34012-biopygen3092